ncbi:hypothetical protein LshimejAT787_1005490 [Lyophyllum shimeji]|uniref:Uncharacterized protein n=1 Tax=Lyophyllum shimeji TaxID=47721 RepID=A0A9P3UNS8_LYOSH|nr:hypothetical protein LshimejAT787_1005490 [Lyophyllum shimeji]
MSSITLRCPQIVSPVSPSCLSLTPSRPPSARPTPELRIHPLPRPVSPPSIDANMPRPALPKLHSPPPSPPNTITALNPLHLPEDDDDSDICPVCDGDCTCHNQPQLPPTAPLSMSQLSALHPASASRPSLPSTTPVPAPKPLLPSLKIKLTVPQSMLGKRRAPHSSVPKNSKNLAETMSVAENGGYDVSSPYNPPPATSQSIPPVLLKRRGRPPKAVVAARQLAAANHEASTLPFTQQKKSAARLPAQLKGRPIVKKPAAGANKRRRVVSSSESSELSDVDTDAQSGQFPTFVSASALSSNASSSSSGDSSDSSDLSSFDDSDSSIEAEEENFILSEIHDRARVRRELLGDDAPKKRDPHNAWVIRPRKKSEGPSDVDMDVDSDATEDEDDEEDEEDGDPDEDEETDERGTGAGYVGLATGWSEDDDESSFDADLFFANLTDSEDRDASSSSTCDDRDGEDGDDSDMDSMMASITSLPSMPPEFEVTEGWDGQIVFTNGLREGQGMLDMDFEAHAASLAETSASPSQESDVEMSTDDVDDGGYEQDADEGEGEGETTDEELVGDDDLPNERAMRLFNLPFSVSAINPMSTMSPAVSPGPRNRRPFGASRSLDSPKPADILSGKVFWDSDDHDEYEGSTARSRSLVSSNGQIPRKGVFVHVKERRQAIIDDSHKDIPSPHPRFRRRGTSYAHFKSVENLLQKHLASQQSPISACSPSPFHLVSPAVEEPGGMSPEMTHPQLVNLDDVLETSFLDPEPSDSQGVSTDNESRKQLQTFHRWDVISVGAFRQSREAADSGWGSDGTPRSKTDYGSMMKSSPLSTMLWQNKANNPKRRSRKMSVVISPVILPVRDRDGDRTPTNIPPPPPHQNHRYDNHYTHKSRKELRRERKLKRKSYGPVHHQHQHHQHHSHHHHPNSKTRSTSSSQRTNFFISSVPPLSL